MAAAETFDITTGCDLQEVDNAVQQAKKEIGQRFDFRGLVVTIEFERKAPRILLEAPDETKLQAALDVVQTKLAKRQVPLKNLQVGKLESAGGSRVRQAVDLQQGIPTETAKAIVKRLKTANLKKVQASIQADQVRVSSPSRDALQEAIAVLEAEDFGMQLKFGNFRNA